MRALSIASGAVCHGLCTPGEMDCHKVEDTEKPGKDLRERFRHAKKAKDVEFIHVHTKAVDEASRAKSAELKRDLLRK